MKYFIFLQRARHKTESASRSHAIKAITRKTNKTFWKVFITAQTCTILYRHAIKCRDDKYIYEFRKREPKENFKINRVPLNLLQLILVCPILWN